MPYLLLIMDHGERRGWTEEQGRRAYDRMAGFRADLEARGLCKASEALKPPSQAVRIEVRGGKRIVVDGPFAEAKEIVSGFFLLDCGTREEAVAIAGECPATEWATVEVRELGFCYEA